VAPKSFPLKIKRASEHFDALKQAVEWWADSYPYAIEEEIDTETDTKTVYLIADRPPSPRLSLMLGDTIQNYRSALDYLVGDLARSNVPGELSRSVERRLQFPITTSRENLKTAVREQGRLDCVPLRAGAYIQRLQPYRRGQDFTTRYLWMLQKLSNIDKHRHIPLLITRVRSVHVIGAGKTTEIFSGGPLVDKAKLVSFSPADADVQVDLDSLRLDIALGEGLPGAGQRMLPFIDQMLAGISASVFTPLARECLNGPFEGPPSHLGNLSPEGIVPT
jgi:hypothetical protein